jgi:hypothetical protein
MFFNTINIKWNNKKWNFKTQFLGLSTYTIKMTEIETFNLQEIILC